MNPSLLSYLACPACGSDLELDSGGLEDGEITTGELRCGRCSGTFPIIRGIPRMNASLGGLEAVARSFDHEWAAQREGAFEEDTLFGRTQDEAWRYFLDGLMIGAGRVRGAAVLDAGCGPGFFTRAIATHEAGLVVGVDMNEVGRRRR
jgi:uncharacterized protein YbaR (Trm112 family)